MWVIRSDLSLSCITSGNRIKKIWKVTLVHCSLSLKFKIIIFLKYKKNIKNKCTSSTLPNLIKEFGSLVTCIKVTCIYSLFRPNKNENVLNLHYQVTFADFNLNYSKCKYKLDLETDLDTVA